MPITHTVYANNKHMSIEDFAYRYMDRVQFLIWRVEGVRGWWIGNRDSDDWPLIWSSICRAMGRQGDDDVFPIESIMVE